MKANKFFKIKINFKVMGIEKILEIYCLQTILFLISIFFIRDKSIEYLAYKIKYVDFIFKKLSDIKRSSL